MKKIVLSLTMLVFALTASAQFQQGKGYIGASLSGLNLSYNSENGLNLGVQAKAGYLFADNWMLLGEVGYDHYGKDKIADQATIGVGFRYYIIQNGLFLGANCNFVHSNHNYNDIMPSAEVGYAFFINRSVTIEPSVYYKHSFKDSDHSTIGLKVGIGVYLFDD